LGEREGLSELIAGASSSEVRSDWARPNDTVAQGAEATMQIEAVFWLRQFRGARGEDMPWDAYDDMRSAREWRGRGRGWCSCE
jgi:hypothetical protein